MPSLHTRETDPASGTWRFKRVKEGRGTFAAPSMPGHFIGGRQKWHRLTADTFADAKREASDLPDKLYAQSLGVTVEEARLVRYLWCEAAMRAVRQNPALKRFYQCKLIQKGLGKAKAAAARKLGIRLWIMLRDQIDYQEFCRRGLMRQKSGGARAGMPGR
jgi:hypothetical protein